MLRAFARPVEREAHGPRRRQPRTERPCVRARQDFGVEPRVMQHRRERRLLAASKLSKNLDRVAWQQVYTATSARTKSETAF